MWWALIEEIAPRSEEMADEKEKACWVRGYHVYEGMWAAAIGEVLVCRCWCVVGKFEIIFAENIFVCFLCTKIFLQRKKQITVFGLKLVMQIGENCATIVDLHLLIW